MNPHIVAFMGEAGVGKTTVADYLVAQQGFKRVKFADPLKNMLRAIGLTEAEIEGDLKNEPCDLLQWKTPRHAMQTLGTEWGRKLIGEKFWTDLWIATANNYRLVVCDDCRFPNEAEVIRSMGGRIVKIIRPDHENPAEVAAHSSETSMNGIEPDVTIINDGSLGRLFEAAREAAFVQL